MKNLTLIIIISLFVISCKDEGNNSNSLTITIGVFTENNGVYTATGQEFIFDSEEECQTWSRTALGGDGHSEESHLHFNAAKNVNYDSNAGAFSWTEYGPELDQASIDDKCATGGPLGTDKTVNSTSYTADNNVFLKITKVE